MSTYDYDSKHQELSGTGGAERTWTPVLASQSRVGRRSADGVYSTVELSHLIEYERLKSRRNGEPNAMLVCHLNGSAGKRRVVRNVVETLTSHVRDTDHVGWLNDAEIGVLLSGTSAEAAAVLKAKLEFSIPSSSIELRVEEL
ncbi:MAG: hypothetical protein EA426_19610 [Spirochaetaceae bacterium]|nr:MAG: hypothetical protein EA426_19610 [Spirochaetaceae bacterium]